MVSKDASDLPGGVPGDLLGMSTFGFNIPTTSIPNHSKTMIMLKWPKTKNRALATARYQIQLWKIIFVVILELWAAPNIKLYFLSFCCRLFSVSLKLLCQLGVGDTSHINQKLFHNDDHVKIAENSKSCSRYSSMRNPKPSWMLLWSSARLRT